MGKRLAVIIVFSLLVMSCNDMFEPDSDACDLPPGMGSFSVSLSAGRTILPATPVIGDFASFTFAFTPTLDGYPESFARTTAQLSLSKQFPLVPGTYTLAVSAFNSDSQLAARGTLSGIIIVEAATTSEEVMLIPILGEPGYQGKFLWDFNVTASGVTSAVMKVMRGDTQVGADVNLSTTGRSAGSRNLDSGIYTVVISLKKDVQALEWNELLYVYAGFESECELEFTNTSFYNTYHNVTLAFGNGQSNGTQSVIHGGMVAEPAPPARTDNVYLYLGTVPTPVGWDFGGWKPDGADTLWNFSTGRVHQNMTLNAVWTGTHLDVSGETGANNFEKAINYVKNHAPDGAFTLYANSDFTVSPQTLDVPGGVTLTLAGTGGMRTINKSGSAVMFDVSGDDVALTLGNNITLKGTGSGSNSLVRVSGNADFILSGGAITGNKADKGGGVYVGANGTFSMTGGTISGNSADLGGGVYIDNEGTFAKSSGGIIYGNDGTANANSALLQGNAVYYDLAYSTRTRTDTAGTGVDMDTAVYPGGWDNFTTVYVDDGNGNISYDNLSEALDSITSSGNYTVTVTADQMLASPYVFAGGASRNVTLAAPAGRNVTIQLSGNGSLFTINTNLIFTIGDRITLRGRAGNDSAVVQISPGGEFRMQGSANITGNTSSSYGGAVSVNSDATFVMNGGTISGNTAARGGGVYIVTGTFVMNGGTINGNTAAENGGGVYITEGKRFTMTGGAISNNKAASGGGFYSTNISEFVMSGGTISGNTATGSGTSGGGGVYNINGNFNMTGGFISDNTAGNGGGVYNTGTGAEFTMAGGTINGNTALNNYGGGVYNNSGTFNMNAGTISGNTALNYGGGVYNTGTGAEFTMTGGTISGNKAYSGGGVYINSGTFKKQPAIGSNSGIIYGYDGTASSNVARNSSETTKGHAVYVAGSPVKRKETNAGLTVGLDSTVAGSGGGWDSP